MKGEGKPNRKGKDMKVAKSGQHCNQKGAFGKPKIGRRNR